MNDPSIDEEEAEPRFLLVGGSMEPAQFAAYAAVLAALQPAALIVSKDLADRLREIKQIACDHSVALLAEDDVDLALGLDGLHLTELGQVSRVRSDLDHKSQDRLILGADVGFSRHDSMVAGEAGADYIAFGERDRSADDDVFALVSWWRDVTVMPCLAYAEDTQTIAKLAAIGTDFIGIGGMLRKHSDDPVTVTNEMKAAIKKS